MNKLLIIALIAIGASTLVSSKILWEKVWFQNISYYIKEMSKADSLNLMALVGMHGLYAQILKSTDAGKTWFVTFDDSTLIVPKHEPYKMSYPEKDFAIVICDSGTFIKTNDGGLTWKKGNIKELHSDNYTSLITMYDKNNGIIYGNKKTFISHDGFETYKQFYFPVSNAVLDFQMLSPDFIFAMVVYYDGNPNYDEKFFKSTNSGESWTEYYYPDYVFPSSIKFIDTLFGFSAGGERTGIGDNTYDYIYRTTNGGETWTKVLDTLCWPPFGLEDIDVLDRKTAIAVGQFGKIYWTHDGGDSWQRDSNALIVDGIPPTLRVCILDENTAIIGDFNNRIWRSYLATDVESEQELVRDQLISPNPATDFIDVCYPPLERGSGGVDIKIMNVFGQILITPSLRDTLPWKGGEKVRIDVSGLAPGMYFVRVGDRVGKLIKL
jgi:photosystem II stability/assembly factor-like uncharacterized protein